MKTGDSSKPESLTWLVMRRLGSSKIVIYEKSINHYCHIFHKRIRLNLEERFFENLSDELSTANTRHLRKLIVNNLLIFVMVHSDYLGTKKIASSRFQSPVKKKNRKLRHWRPTARSLATDLFRKLRFLLESES